MCPATGDWTNKVQGPKARTECSLNGKIVKINKCPNYKSQRKKNNNNRKKKKIVTNHGSLEGSMFIINVEIKSDA